MDQPIALSLQGHFFQHITPGQIVHRLTDDGFSHFDYGPWRVAIRATDLTQVRAARQLAQTIAAQATFWDGDLAVVEARLVTEQAAHIADAPAPGQNPTPAPEPTLANQMADQLAAPDPELDAAVEKVATRPETRRRSPAKEK